MSQYMEFVGKSARLHLDKDHQDNARPARLPVEVPCGPPIPYTVCVSDEALKACTQGPAFAWRIRLWASSLIWSCDSNSTSDIAWAELYADFCLFTKSRSPVNILIPGSDEHRKLRNLNQSTNFQLRDKNHTADSMVSDFGTELRVFHTTCRALVEKLGAQLWPAQFCDDVQSMRNIGFTVKTQGLNRRPYSDHLQEATTFLAKKIMFSGKAGCRRTRRNLQFDSPHSRMPIATPSMLDIDNSQRFINYRQYVRNAALGGA